MKYLISARIFREIPDSFRAFGGGGVNIHESQIPSRDNIRLSLADFLVRPDLPSMREIETPHGLPRLERERERGER